MMFRSLGLLLLTLTVLCAPARAGTYVQFRTVLGDLEVELFDQDKPVTVANFIRYVNRLNGEFYRDAFIHRCEPGFVLQGGEYITLNRLDTNLVSGETVYAYPTFPPIVNEFNVGPRISNSYGTLAMARTSGATNSATSEWFFNLTNNAALDNVDGGFTVFGRVLRGTNVLNYFNGLSYNHGVMDMWNFYPFSLFGIQFNQVPVLYNGPQAPRIADLIYVDITLLSVKVARLTGGAREISWNSVAGRTNRVEFTTNFPPTWQSFVSTNGTGNNMKVTDSSTGTTRKFYRVRVDF